MRIVVAVVAGLVANPAQAAASPPASPTVFRDLIAARLVALTHGDWPAYRRLLASDFVHISDLGQRRTVAELRAFVADHAGSRATHDVVGLAWRRAGRLAIVDAEVDEHTPDVDTAWYETDVFVVRAGRWTFLHHQETPIAHPATAAVVVGDRIADYAGRYRSARGTEDIIVLDGERLTARGAPADPPTALVPVAQGVFAVAGDPTIVSFIRNPEGRVTGCFFHLPSGQIAVSTRVEGP